MKTLSVELRLRPGFRLQESPVVPPSGPRLARLSPGARGCRVPGRLKVMLLKLGKLSSRSYTSTLGKYSKGEILEKCSRASMPCNGKLL